MPTLYDTSYYVLQPNLNFNVTHFFMQHSWKWFIYYRCQNVNRQSKQEGSSRKRLKVDDRAIHLCPPTLAEDDVSFGRNIEQLTAELAKPKPRSDVTKDLMRRTFPNRWDMYVNQNEPPTLLEYLAKYPLLKKASYVSKLCCVHFCVCFGNAWQGRICLVNG